MHSVWPNHDQVAFVLGLLVSSFDTWEPALYIAVTVAVGVH